MSNVLTLKTNGKETIFGVCSGLADYFDTDVTVIRLMWVISGFFSLGFSIFLYLCFALVMPEDPASFI